MNEPITSAEVALSSAPGRTLIGVTALGSGMVFLDCTVTPIALPAVAGELGGGLSVQQWILDGYLLTLSALLLPSGAMGDRYGRRRMFVLGLSVFAVASVGCGLAPSSGLLVLARVAQGAGGALLLPVSLALISSVIRREDRGRALGAWAGLSGVASALGPVVGGWLVDSVSWRAVFLINVPLAAIAIWAALRHTHEPRRAAAGARPDMLGAVAITIGLTGLTFSLIEGPVHGWNNLIVLSAGIGALGLLAFPFIEANARSPLLPLGLFRSRHFIGANVTTFAVEGAIGGAFFLLAVHLQQSLDYSPLAAGLAMLPLMTIMVVLAAPMGEFAQRHGSRLPLSVGPLVCAAGLALLSRIGPGAEFETAVLPGVLVFGLGLATTVAPLTTAVLAPVEESQVGVASGINNAVAWTAGLLAIAVLPAAAGIDTNDGVPALGEAYAKAMLIAAAICALGGTVAAVTLTVTPLRGPVPADADVSIDRVRSRP